MPCVGSAAHDGSPLKKYALYKFKVALNFKPVARSTGLRVRARLPAQDVMSQLRLAVAVRRQHGCAERTDSVTACSHPDKITTAPYPPSPQRDTGFNGAAREREQWWLEATHSPTDGCTAGRTAHR